MTAALSSQFLRVRDKRMSWLKCGSGDPGSILTGRQRERCRLILNQREITVPGLHFTQEDSPLEIGSAVADWRLEVQAAGHSCGV